MIICEREIGMWTVRVNGTFIADFFWRGEARARRLAMNLQKALENT